MVTIFEGNAHKYKTCKTIYFLSFTTLHKQASQFCYFYYVLLICGLRFRSVCLDLKLVRLANFLLQRVFHKNTSSTTEFSPPVVHLTFDKLSDGNRLMDMSGNGNDAMISYEGFQIAQRQGKCDNAGSLLG